MSIWAISCAFVCLCICVLCICVFVHLSVCAFLCYCICVFVHLYVIAFVCLYICVFVHLCVCTFCVFVHLCVCAFAFLCICVLSIWDKFLCSCVSLNLLLSICVYHLQSCAVEHLHFVLNVQLAFPAPRCVFVSIALPIPSRVASIAISLKLKINGWHLLAWFSLQKLRNVALTDGQLSVCLCVCLSLVLVQQDSDDSDSDDSDDDDDDDDGDSDYYDDDGNVRVRIVQVHKWCPPTQSKAEHCFGKKYGNRWLGCGRNSCKMPILPTIPNPNKQTQMHFACRLSHKLACMYVFECIDRS